MPLQQQKSLNLDDKINYLSVFSKAPDLFYNFLKLICKVNLFLQKCAIDRTSKYQILNKKTRSFTAAYAMVER